MRAYSPDLRQRIVEAVAAGDSPSTVAVRFCVHRETVRRYVRRHAATGTLAPSVAPGGVRHIPVAAHPALLAQLAAWPDATLDAHRERWAREQGVAVSRATIQRAVARVGWTRKKRRS